MNFQFYVEKLKASPTYNEFMKKNPDAFPCSGFFVIDKEGKDNQQHFDFWIPVKKNIPAKKSNGASPTTPNSRPGSDIDKKNLPNSRHSPQPPNDSKKKVESDDDKVSKKGEMISFKLESNCEIAPIQMIDEKIPEQISLDLDFDFKEVVRLVEDRKEQEGIRKKTQKYLFSLQKKDGKHYLIGTVFISMLGMLKVQIDLEKKEIIDFEKKSFFDIMKVKKGKKED